MAKTAEKQLKENIAKLKKNLDADKKNHNNLKITSVETKDDKEPKMEKHSFNVKRVLITALPFLIIIAFVAGFISGVGYEQNKNPETTPASSLDQDGSLENQQPSQQSQQEPEAEVSECLDTDEGFDIFLKGEVVKGTSLYYDRCEDNKTLREYYCFGNEVKQSPQECVLCEDGACIEFQTRDTGCKESDNYADYYVKGYVLDKKGRLYEDTCSRNSLEEYYCDIYGYGATSYKLCDSCVDGACVQTQQESSECYDSDNGIDYYTKGTVVDAKGRSFTDNCQKRTLEEYYCSPLGYYQTSYKLCSIDCLDGACLQAE